MLVADGLKSKSSNHRDTHLTITNQSVYQRNCYERFSDCIQRQLTVTRKELLNTNDLSIVKRRRMKIYSISNLMCFLI